MSWTDAPSAPQTALIRKLGGDPALCETRREASDLIAQLQAQAGRKAYEATKIDRSLTPGVYEVEGTVYVVRPNKDKTRLYAKVLVETGGTRITEAGVEVREIDFEYKPGAIYGIKVEHRMDVERAKALTALYGRCIVCGRHLKAAESVERGIGPVCIKSFKHAVADPIVETADGRTGSLSDFEPVDPTRYAAVSRVGYGTPERMAQIEANYRAAKGEPSAGELYPPHEPDEANLDTIKASEVGWMIRTVGSALSCAAGEYDLPADDIERVKAMLGRLIADGIEHGRVIA